MVTELAERDGGVVVWNVSLRCGRRGLKCLELGARRIGLKSVLLIGGSIMSYRLLLSD